MPRGAMRCDIAAVGWSRQVTNLALKPVSGHAVPSYSEVAIGATYGADGRCRFLVWAPFAHTVEVHLRAPRERFVPMQQESAGYYQVYTEEVEPGSLYTYRLDEQIERPDPASRCQPQDVHGPSQVVDPRFPWQDQQWGGLPLQAYILYELHVGTFTAAGTFAAIIPHLDALKRLGVTAIELMPIAQFPGQRNWGYDGVQPFAAQYSATFCCVDSWESFSVASLGLVRSSWASQAVAVASRARKAPPWACFWAR